MGFLGSLLGGGGGGQKSAYDPALGGHILGSDGQGGILGDARSQYGQGPPVYDPNYRIADFTGAEQAGQRSLQAYGSQTLPGMFNQGMGNLYDLMGGTQTNQNLMQGMGNPMLQQAGSGQLSPHMQGVMSGAMNDMSRNYTNTTNGIMDQFQTALGGANDQALMSGQFGGSRGGVAQGIVGKEASRQTGLANQALSENMSQATSNVLNEQFSGARDAQLSAGQSMLQSQLNASQMDMNGRLGALGMLPQMGEFGAMGGRLMGEVGGAQRSLEQAQLDQGREQWNFQQDAPWQNMNRYSQLVQQLGPYMQMTQQQGGGSGGILGGALGGAVSGFGATGTPMGAWAGGIAGALGS